MRAVISSVGMAFLLTLCMVVHAQSKRTVKEKKQTTASAQQFFPPRFPGGDSTLQDYLRRNIRYPNLAREQEIEGTVRLEFFINEQGLPEDIRVIRGIGGGCSQEAIRVVKNMPSWTPGTYKGRKIRMLYALPLGFQLRN